MIFLLFFSFCHRHKGSISTLFIGCDSWLTKQFIANADSRHRRHRARLLWWFLGWSWPATAWTAGAKTCTRFLPTKRFNIVLHGLCISTAEAWDFWCAGWNRLHGTAARIGIQNKCPSRSRAWWNFLHFWRCTEQLRTGWRTKTLDQLWFSAILRK